MWPVVAGMAASSLLTSYMGNEAAKEQSEAAAGQANALRQQALAELSNMTPIELSQLGYDPAMIEYIKGPEPLLYSQPADVQANMVTTDPATREAQMKMLEELSTRSDEGLSAADRYNFMKNRRDTETAARGQEQAIMANLQQRGMGGTGIEAAMRMLASQGGSDRLAEAQAAEAASNANIRLNALSQQGALAGNIRGQDIGLAQTNADILNQLAWNNSERNRQIQNMNIDMQNQAAQSNVAEQRNVQSVNVGAQNQASLANNQQRIQNELARQESERQTQMARAGALTSGIPDIYAQGAANAAGDRQMWNTVGGAANMAGQMYMTQSQADQASRDRALDRQAYGNPALSYQPTGNASTTKYNNPPYATNVY